MPDLSQEETLRYARHLILPEVNLEGQKKLKAARVLCIGLGGIGSPTALYLAAAGVGNLGLIDDDIVDLSNLQRQVIHGTSDIGRKKIESARDRIKELNPHTEVTLYDEFFSMKNATKIVKDYDLVIDGSDNFETRYLSNDVCFFLKKPNVYGSVFRFDCQFTLFAPHLGGPCYRCLFPEMPPPDAVPNCAEGGVLGVLPGIVGIMQSLQALKFIIGIGEPLLGRFVHLDTITMKFREFDLRKDPHCPLCGKSPTITHLMDQKKFMCTSKTMTAHSSLPTITVEELKHSLASSSPGILIDVREPWEYEAAHIAQARPIPLGELASRAHELNPADTIYLQCRSGGRSAKALQILKEAGFEKLFNVEGGILAWSERIDASIKP
ncbi:MAG: molybdopterin-synthase adenylyltransferase MoeB [Chthoniobacterales bacterium]